jgi:hypothetical protein
MRPEKIKLIFIIIILMITMFFIIWGASIFPKQLEFTNRCEAKCLQINLSYDVSFASIPWNNVNGKCYCKQRFEMEMVNP